MKKQVIKRLGCLVASFLFMFVSASAFATEWFANSVQQTLGSEWSNTDTWVWTAGDPGYGSFNSFTAPLTYTPETPQGAASDVVSVATKVKFTALDVSDLTTEGLSGVKGGLTVVEDLDAETPATNYYGIVSGEWKKLSGTPTLEDQVIVTISLFTENGTKYISYKVGDTYLTYNESSKIATTLASDATIESVQYVGKGEVATLSGAKETNAYDLTVPEIANASAEVTVGGNVIEPTSTMAGAAVYNLAYGTAVTVTYKPATDYTVENGTFTISSLTGPQTVSTTDVSVHLTNVALTVPVVENTTVAVTTNGFAAAANDPSASPLIYTIPYGVNVAVTYTPAQDYKFSEGDGQFTYDNMTEATSVDTTQFTVVEKAKATVTITETHATATVSVVTGTQVYEGTTITVTDVAAADGYTNPTCKINDTATTTYTTLASDETVVIVISAEANPSYPIEPTPAEKEAGVPTLTVDMGALADRDPSITTPAAAKTYLATTQANGQKGWVNYALGIADNEAPVLEDAGNATTVKIDLGNAGTAPTSGATSKIVKSDGTTETVLEGGEIAITGETVTEVFTVKLIVTDAAKEKSETVVEKDVGIEKKTPTTALEIISVPFTDLASDTTISIESVLKGANLTAGDKVYVYDAENGQNVSWTLNSSGAWEGTGSANLKPGDGIWLERQNLTGAVYAFGGYQTEPKSTAVTAGKWAIVANPNLFGNVNLNEAVTGGEGDQIVVETGAAPKTYTYEQGAWGYNATTTAERKVGKKTVTVKTVTRKTDDTLIPAGAGFWFGNAGEAAKTINWSTGK